MTTDLKYDQVRILLSVNLKYIKTYDRTVFPAPANKGCQQQDTIRMFGTDSRIPVSIIHLLAPSRQATNSLESINH